MQQLSVFLTFFIALTIMGIGLLVSRRAGYRFPYGRAVLLIWIGSALIGLTMYILRWQTKTAARFPLWKRAALFVCAYRFSTAAPTIFKTSGRLSFSFPLARASSVPCASASGM